MVLAHTTIYALVYVMYLRLYRIYLYKLYNLLIVNGLIEPLVLYFIFVLWFK